MAEQLSCMSGQKVGCTLHCHFCEGNARGTCVEELHVLPALSGSAAFGPNGGQQDGSGYGAWPEWWAGKKLGCSWLQATQSRLKNMDIWYVT